MRFLQFLQYELGYICLFFGSYLIISLVFFTSASDEWQWRNFFYTLLLVTIALGVFLGIKYRKITLSLQNMAEFHGAPVSFEAVHYQKYLEELNRNHIKALNVEQAKQRDYHDFIVAFVHEIKTPIAVLRLLGQTKIEPKSLQEEVMKIEYYVDQTLYYAKLDTFHQDYEITNCDLQDIAKKAVKTHAKTFISHKIQLNLSVSTCAVPSDSKWLLFILNQLITNSLKYIGENGIITISTVETATEKQLIIEDNGIGIAEKDLPRIFSRGFTGTNGRKHAKSTGMGLYLAQQLSNKLGHYITCTSMINQYTKMVIHFPKNDDRFISITENVEE